MVAAHVVHETLEQFEGDCRAADPAQYTSFAPILRRAERVLGLSPPALAALLGVDRITLQHWQTGGNAPLAPLRSALYRRLADQTSQRRAAAA